MQPIRAFTARSVALLVDNIDTDQIIPARFLKGTTRAGLGRSLFADWRYDASGQPRPDFVLNRPEAQGAEVLVAGDNFGCGSSREHAPWALLDAGFRAVVIVLERPAHARLAATAGAPVTVDLEAQTVTLPDGTKAAFAVEPFARYCLLNGVDELGFLLQQGDAIARYEQTHN
jgi:3-isopropylmalate/(R)-2-methylmalate dehydratase small subunit